MALVREFTCTVCEEDRHEVVNGNNGVCASCRTKAADTNRRMHIGALRALTLEERLALIEAQLYDLAIERRLAKLEARTATYA